MAHVTNKEINKLIGFKRCPKWLKEVYRKSANYICQHCNKPESEVGKLQPHRIKRGNIGGLYTLCRFSDKNNNVLMLCKKCHLRLHNKEW